MGCASERPKPTEIELNGYVIVIICAVIKSSYYTSASITGSSRDMSSLPGNHGPMTIPQAPAIQNPVAVRAVRVSRRPTQGVTPLINMSVICIQ